MNCITLFLSLFIVYEVVESGSPSKSKISASIKNKNVSGMDDLNLNIVVPFKIQDYVVGFKCAIKKISQLPDSIFARKSFDTPLNGNIALNSEFDFRDNILSLSSLWKNDNLGLKIGADSDSHNFLKSFDVSKLLSLDNKRLSLSAGYNLLKKKLAGSTSLNIDAATLSVAYDTEKHDPVFTVAYSIDKENEVVPSISAKSGEMTLAYIRKWNGGLAKTKLFHNKKISIDWVDEGASGAWTTSAEFSLKNRADSKVSLSRDWSY